MTVEQLVKLLTLQCNTGAAGPDPLAVVSIFDIDKQDYIMNQCYIDRGNRPGKNDASWNDCRKKKILGLSLGLDFKDRANLTIVI